MPDRHVSLEKIEQIIYPLMMLATKKSDEHLEFLLRKLINTHLSFAKRPLSGTFIEGAHRLIEQLSGQKESFMQMMILYKILSRLYIIIVDHKELHFLAKRTIQKMNSAPPEFILEYPESLKDMQLDLESSAIQMSAVKNPEEPSRPMRPDEIDLLSALNSAMDAALDLHSQFKDMNILLPEDYDYLRSVLLTNGDLDLGNL